MKTELSAFVLAKAIKQLPKAGTQAHPSRSVYHIETPSLLLSEQLKAHSSENELSGPMYRLSFRCELAVMTVTGLAWYDWVLINALELTVNTTGAD